MAAMSPLSAALPMNMFGISGWQFVAPGNPDIHTVCKPETGGVWKIAGKPVGYLVTPQPHRNFSLHLEWSWIGKPGNGGVLLNVSSGPVDREWPTCIQVQLKNTRTGDLLPMAGATFAELPGAGAKQLDRQAADSEKPAGQWNSIDITCRGDSLECSINGVRQNAATHCTPAEGRIGIQLEGTPFKLRNFRVTPLP